MNYKAFIARVAPTVLRGHWGSRLAGTIGLLFDMQAESLRHALRAPMVEDTLGPALDALGAYGREVSLERYPIETTDQYLARLKRAWSDWPFAGDESILLAQLAAAGFAGVEIKYDHDWDWDGTTYWSRFWVVLTGTPFDAWFWGDGHLWGDGHAWGSLSASDPILAVKSLVRKWKPAHWICLYIIVVTDEIAWAADQPDGTWDDPANRNSAAFYVPG